MALLVVDGNDLLVRLAWWEKAVARDGNVRVPLSAVRTAAVEHDWWRPLRGAAGPGRGISGGLSLGVRRHPAGRDFVAVRGHGPVVCVELSQASPFARLAISVPDPEATAQVIRSAVEGHADQPQELARRYAACPAVAAADTNVHHA
jgi:hypothetical protein